MLIDVQGNIMKTVGTVILYMNAPNSPGQKIKFVVTNANEEKIMVSWSDLIRLGILAEDFPK